LTGEEVVCARVVNEGYRCTKLEEWGKMLIIVVVSTLETSQPKSSEEELGGFLGARNRSSRSDARFPTGGRG
jgi:hypothetical protein